MLYPRLPIEKGSATGIEEEDLCASVLIEQEAAYNGTNKCVKEGNLFWFKCAPGFKEVGQETSGRLRRSICEPGTDDSTSGTDDPTTKPATEGQAPDQATEDSTDDPATKRTPEPVSAGTTAKPERSAGSSVLQPQLLQLLLLCGGFVTLLQALVH